MKEPIVFKTEDSLWQMMARGEKTWDARRYDMADDRIYRLAWGKPWGRKESRARRDQYPWEGWVPDEKTVSFWNKATEETLTFRYLGMEFTPWAPGWCFLLLGEWVEEEKER